jgi:hypothetical protein
MPTQQPTTWTHPRAFPRYLMDQRLLLNAGVVLHGRTKDISEGGLGATVAGEVPGNSPVELEFSLPGSSTPLKLMAEIRYHQGFQYGFRFLHILETQRARIRDAAQQLPPAP